MYGQSVIHNGTIPTICRQCDMRCGIEVGVESGRIAKITGMKAHPQNRGRLCPKGSAAVDTVYHPERLLTPLKKNRNGSFDQIPLEQAMEEITERLAAIGEKHGRRSIAAWHGEALGFAQQEMYPRRFLHALGSPNFLSVNSLCYVSRYIAYRLVQGYWNACPDFSNARCILLWGTNPPVSHFTFMQPIEEAKRRGARLVVIDPRSTEIARKADLHLRPKPGTDGALAWGLMRRLIQSGHYDKEFVSRYGAGFEAAAAYADQFTIQMVSAATGVPPEKIEECGSLIVDGRFRTVNYVGVSLEHQENGVNTVRAIACLGGLIGAVDREGGDPWPESLGERALTLYDELPLLDQEPIGVSEYPLLYDFYKECNTMKAVEAMLGKGPYPLRALIVCGGNPVNTNPNTAKVAEAFSGLELLVVRELFLTETTALADYVLPAASFIERAELHIYAHYQWVSMSRRILQIPGILDEYAFWRDLAHGLGFGNEYFPWQSEEEVNRWLLEPTGITPQQLRDHPEGMEYKTVRYEKYRKQPLATLSGKFEFASGYLQDLGHPALPVYEEPYYLRNRSEDFPYLLISGARKREYLHSRYRNIPKLRRLHPQAEIELNPADAAALGVRDGEDVRVSSEIGSVVLPARIVGEEELLPGMVQITHGWEGQGNVNRLTSDTITDPISGFPLLTSVPVRLEAVYGGGDSTP
ncbi:MAG: molybdopterin-dependent oxidoreductase [Spirochaetaceae bacterium]|nr:MAG: molybdopterin-dependent oxidoreductase [Spirochaetaceae bacterium]